MTKKTQQLATMLGVAAAFQEPMFDSDIDFGDVSPWDYRSDRSKTVYGGKPKSKKVLKNRSKNRAARKARKRNR